SRSCPWLPRVRRRWLRQRRRRRHRARSPAGRPASSHRARADADVAGAFPYGTVWSGRYGTVWKPGWWGARPMNAELTIAGLGCAALATGHGVIGRWVLSGLRSYRLPATPFGPPSVTAGMVRFTWHIVTV